jgi:gamma-glutamyltranspeptidase/glutathione hydrolase
MAAGLAGGSQPYRARHAMVVSGETHASEIGAQVLQCGGNAMDAAVAVGFALGVTHSGMSGLGGGGFLLVRLEDGRTSFFDFRERAPGKASRDMFLQADGSRSPESVTGWRAAAVPGNVRGFELAHRTFGTRPWAELLQPAIALAAKGHPISYMRAQAFRNRESLSRDPESRRIFQKGGAFHEPGDLLVQPELAHTLERVAKYGAKEFYEGETARRFAREMASHGGLITLEDLKAYTVSESKPLIGRYRGLDVITASGSSSGGVGLLQMLGVLEESGYEKTGAGSAAAIHFMAEAMRRWFADRSKSIGDPDFFRIPYDRLLDKQYIGGLRQSIDPDRATASRPIHAGKATAREGSDTTHFSVVDAEGNAVAVTFTLNNQFGSGVTVPGLGFILNSDMDDFAADPGKTNQYGMIQGEANAIQPGKRPVSSMTPTIVARDGKLYMALGTPGGLTIMNSVLQALVNVVDFKMNAQDAVSAPRFHHQWFPDRIFLEPGFSPDTIALLKARGHEVEFKASNNDMMMILSDGDWLQAGVDPRREGKAAGY